MDKLEGKYPGFFSGVTSNYLQSKSIGLSIRVAA